MSAWLVALVLAVVLVLVGYAGRRPRPVTLIAALLRGVAVLLVAGLLLDAPTGRAHSLASWAALDVSSSWGRGTGTDLWRHALDSVRAARADTVLAFGDSARPADLKRAPGDLASRAEGAVELALARGRPLVVVTDGEVDDPASLAELPSGSRVVVLARPATADLAVTTLDVPRAMVSGDTVEAHVGLAAGAAGAPAATLTLQVGGRPLGTARVEALPAYGERTVSVRGAVPGSPAATVASAVVVAPGDAEPRNDTVAVGVDVAAAAGAVFVSTSPDYDSRYALSVLRGALAIPTRGYLRVAPGQWRVEGALTPVSESDVRRAFADAPVAVLHGDTAIFGAPRSAARGPLALMVQGSADQGEWYATTAAASPLAPALEGLPFDSLPPVSVPVSAPRGEWSALLARHGREADQRPIVVGSEQPRRVVVVAASGIWRWRFRGGTSADAFTALWGSIFDWLAEQRADRRAAVPDGRLLRAGEPVVWRRGSSADSAVTLVLQRRGDAARDTLRLRFAGGASVVESAPLAPGTYDVAAPGGAAVLVVNASRELLPRAPRVRSGAVGSAPLADTAPRLRALPWAYALALLLLCAEWVLRRRIGMR